MVQIICNSCKQLVSVVDKTIERHGACPAGGTRYVPSPRSTSSEGLAGAMKEESFLGPRGRPMEVLAAAEIPCAACGDHPVAFAALLRETPLKESTRVEKEYPTWTGPVSAAVD